MINVTNMIYLIDFGTCLKIGRTLDLKKRMKAFFTSREEAKCLDLIVTPTITLDVVAEDDKLEKELHKRCKNFHITNEMFQKTDEVINIFTQYKKEVGDTHDYTQMLEDLLDSTSKKQGSTWGKPAYQYDLEGNFVAEYNSRVDAEKDNNIYYGKVKEVIKGRRLTSGGFIWSDHPLSEEEIKEHLRKISNSKRSKLDSNTSLNQYTLDGAFIRSWKTMTEASKTLGISVSSISLCCSGNYKKAGGFVWKIE